MSQSSGEDQNNNMERDLHEKKRKREDADVAASPLKKTRGRRMMTRSTDPTNTVKDVGVKKRKAAAQGQTVSKRRRRCHLNNSTEQRVEDIRIQRGKRKASDGGEAPKKKVKSHHTSSKPFVAVPGVPPTSFTECSFDIKRDVKARDERVDVSQDFGIVSAEEEKIYEMSSSGNRSGADFEEKYFQLKPIGAGGFGSVYNGIRVSDFLPVAIKRIPKSDVMRERVMCNGKIYNVILEVAFLLKTAGLPGSVGKSTAVSLLDWYTLNNELILVMEKPFPCKDLMKYVQARGGSLDEQEAKKILRQLVDAAIEMHSKGVFHRDIKPQNILVQLESGETRVRIIDFGCGTFSGEKSYHSFCGTRKYAPPEWLHYRTYEARPTTVWQLGALFYCLLSGHERFTTMGFIDGEIRINGELSRDCRSLLFMCLNRDPTQRVTLEELQQHLALKK